MTAEHILEQRASAIAEAIRKQQSVISQALKPQDNRQPFTTQLSDQEALAWWQRNRYTEFGQRVLANMQPLEVMELDQWLSRANEQEVFGYGVDPSQQLDI